MDNAPKGFRFSMVTNASLADDIRIKYTVPSWLRVFGDRIEELVIVLDLAPPSGRVASLHGSLGSEKDLRDSVDDLVRLDPRIRIVVLPDMDGLAATCRKWFTTGMPIRCQCGTPIAAFLFAIDSARSEIVVRVDCDIVFSSARWLNAGVELLDNHGADIVCPPRIGVEKLPQEPVIVTTRALLLRPAQFIKRHTPMYPHTLGILRRIHRWMHGRAGWLALEQMLGIERDKKRLIYKCLPHDVDFSLHFARRDDFRYQDIERIIQSIEAGIAPQKQRIHGWDFLHAAWESQAT